MTSPGDMSLHNLEVDDRQIWLRAFYGFDPEGAGYIGFTNFGDRRAMMETMREGDLILIYGAVEDLTEQRLRAQALGFLEVSLEECADRDRISEASLAWKVKHGFEERWTHGIKVRRAWRVRNRVAIKTIAPKAYESKNRFVRTTRAILLTPDERLRALSHPVQQTNVFGEPSIPQDKLTVGAMAEVLQPSRGVPPSFGERTSNHRDGENQVYLMQFTAQADLLVGKSSKPGHALMKVGRSNDPKRRLSELNCGFPAPTAVGWKLVQRCSYADGTTAHKHETALKDRFASLFTSQGGEFFTGDGAAMIRSFQDYNVSNSPRILGAPAKAQGLK